MQSSSVLELRDVVVQFGGVRAVSSLSFQLPWRGFMGLIGPNGAGKTTVFNAITGAVKPASGDILIDSKSLIGLEPHEIADSGIARTFQNIRLFPRMTVLRTSRLPFTPNRDIRCGKRSSGRLPS